MAQYSFIGPAALPRARCKIEDWGPDADFPPARRARTWALRKRRARARVRRAEARRPNGLPGLCARRYPPRRRAGLTVSRYERVAFRRGDRTAT